MSGQRPWKVAVSRGGGLGSAATSTLWGRVVVFRRRGDELVSRGWRVCHQWPLLYFLSIFCSFPDVISSGRHVCKFPPANQWNASTRWIFRKKDFVCSPATVAAKIVWRGGCEVGSSIRAYDSSICRKTRPIIAGTAVLQFESLHETADALMMVVISTHSFL